MALKSKQQQKDETKQAIIKEIRNKKLDGLLNDEDVESILKDLMEAKGWMDEPS